MFRVGEGRDLEAGDGHGGDGQDPRQRGPPRSRGAAVLDSRLCLYISPYSSFSSIFPFPLFTLSFSFHHIFL